MGDLLSIAPMIDWTYSHFRVLMRILAPNALLYTEMQTPDAIKFNPQRCLHFNPFEAPIAIQLGGSDKKKLVEAAISAEKTGYKEINLNLGCPSERVQSGSFGACLMVHPELVANCISAIKERVNIPVTAKTRIGIDNHDSYDFFANFCNKLIDAGCDKLIIHARKAWLKGLSPKQNRTIPKINYDYAYRLKKDLPSIPIIINGDIKSNNDVLNQLQHVDGVMLGRLAYQNPYAIALIHKQLFPTISIASRTEVIQKYIEYTQRLDLSQERITFLLKPLFNLFHGQLGAKSWKEKLTNLQHMNSLSSILSELH